MTQNLAGCVVDGKGTQISLGSNSLQEVSITPPSISSGGEINTTTHRNGTWRTKSPKILKEFGEVSFSAVYDPAQVGTMLTSVGTNQEITVTFADSTTLVFYGYIDSFSPGEITEGELPTADVTIIPTLQDGTASAPGSETAPTFSG